jgi:hypothetical protein
MGERTLCCGLAIALTLSVRPARAESNVSVVRGDGADLCPDEAALKGMAETAAAHASRPPTHAYRVAFDRSAGRYHAEIIDDTGGRTRALQDSGAVCGPLGHAAAVVLATMWSSEDEAAPRNAEPALPPPRPQEQTHAMDRAPARPVASSMRWLFGIGSGLAEGIVRPAAPALVANGAGELGPVSLSIGALWIPGQNLDLGPGVVSVQLIAGVARVCASPFVGIRAGGCGGFFAGALSAAATGYSGVSQASRPWFAGSAELFVDGPLPIAPFRYRGSVEGIVPVHAEAFAVTGVGLAYAAPAFGALFTLALEVESR